MMAISVKKIWKRWAVPSFLFALFLVAYFLWTAPEALVERVQVGQANDVVLGNVYVREKHTTQITSRIRGAIAGVYVQVGDHVKQGDLLVEWRDSSLIDRIQEQEALRDERMNVRSLKTPDQFAYESLLRDYDTALKESAQGGRSERDIELMERDISRLREQIELRSIADENVLAQLNFGIDRMTLLLKYSKLYAPSDGIITEIYKREGEVVGLGERVMDLIYVQKIIVAEIAEQDIDRINEGDPCLIKLLGFGRNTFSGEVAFKLPRANRMTNRFDVHLKTEVPDEELVPGLTGEVSIILGSREGSLLVRPESLQDRLVYVVENGVVRARTVEVGYRGITHVEILNGLAEGEWVISREMGRFRAGQWVKPKRRG